MTISSETCSVTANGNDATTEFNYSFLIPYQADGVTPAVYAFTTTASVDTPLVLDTDYSITGTDDPDGGSVTYPLSGDPLTTGSTITIQRAEDYVQPYAFPNQGFRPDQVEAAFDWLCMQIQQLNRRVADLEA